VTKAIVQLRDWLGGLGRIPVLFLAILLFAAANPALAQKGFVHPVKTSAAWTPAEAKPGDKVRLDVTVTLPEEYHIYGMYLTGEGPVATSIEELDFPAWLEPTGKWVEPAPTVKFDEGFQTDIELHHKTSIVFSREFLVGAGAVSGETPLKVGLTAQACRETNCLPPKEFKTEATLTITGGAAAPAETPAAAAVTPTPTPAPTPAATAVKATPQPVASANGGDEEPQGFIGFLIFAFGAGLFSLLTPCVFPMIPITISYFTKRASNTRAGAIKLAWTYGGTIVAGFAAFGFVLSLILKGLGQGDAASGFINKVAADPTLNLVLATLFIAFAFNLFGMFEISLPGGISDRLQKMKGNRSDALGAMFMALIFVVVSFTCTAPIVGTLLVAAVRGEWTRPLFGLIAYGSGFALPFFLLALVPSALQSLPKSGGWLHSTKVVMGLLELAAALKFLSNSDMVWEWGLFTREVVLAAWGAIAFATMLYILGKIRLPQDDETPTISPLRMVGGIVFGAVTLVCIGGLGGGKLPSYFEAYLPIDLNAAHTSNSAAKDELQFLPEYADALVVAKATGKPIFMDFTGITCTNCRLMERNVFPQPAVEELLKQYVLVKLWTDHPVDGERHQELQIEKFNTIALPTYAILSPDGNTTRGVTGYTPNAGEFVKFLEKGLAR
jgi:thiol:disulfide interchange protein